MEFHLTWERIFRALAPDPHDVSGAGGDAPAHRVMSSRSGNFIHRIFAIHRQELQNEVLLEIGHQRKQCHIDYL
ncbi:hypothetical protein D3C80_2081230 [compost metagenome]